jgi:hypothetical protein
MLESALRGSDGGCRLRQGEEDEGCGCTRAIFLTTGAEVGDDAKLTTAGGVQGADAGANGVTGSDGVKGNGDGAMKPEGDAEATLGEGVSSWGA